MNEHEENMMSMPHHRATDDETAPVKISREIPLWGILSVCGAIGTSGVAMYFGQQRLVEQMVEVRAEVRSLKDMSTTRERDMAMIQLRIEDHSRRILEMEKKTKP